VAAIVVGKHLAGQSLSHSAFNNLMAGVAGVAIATSPGLPDLGRLTLYPKVPRCWQD
jgi:hypothetical protein